jgi:hypothetical protein
MLKALRVMPIEAALAQKTMLAHAVKRCTMHGDPDIRKLAGYLTKQWAVAGSDGGNGSSGDGKSNGNHAANVNNRATSPTNQAGGNGHPRVTVTKLAPPPPKIEFDEETKRQMAEAEAEVQRLEAAAAALTAEAAAAEAEAQMVSQKVKVKSFSQFKQDQKKKPKTKIPRSSGSHGSGSGGSHGGGGDLAGGEEEGEFNFKYKLDALISSRLRPYLESRSLSKEAYKEILNKASEKILARVTAEDLAQGRVYYEKRKKKFIELVDAYLRGYKK